MIFNVNEEWKMGLMMMTSAWLSFRSPKLKSCFWISNGGRSIKVFALPLITLNEKATAAAAVSLNIFKARRQLLLLGLVLRITSLSIIYKKPNRQLFLELALFYGLPIVFLLLVDLRRLMAVQNTARRMNSGLEIQRGMGSEDIATQIPLMYLAAWRKLKL